MSASMYNNPYIYPEPLPRIEYPPLFPPGSRFSFKHFLDSKFLALGGLLFFIAIFISGICIFSPFWFKLVFSSEDGTFGNEAIKRELSIDTGIFFIDEGEYHNLVELNKFNNQDVVPRLLVLAQVLEVAGVCCLVACFAGTLILALRRFASSPANFILAFFASLSGVFMLLAFLFVLIMAMMSSCDPYDAGDCNYKDNLKWRVFPIYTQRYRVAPLVTPLIKLNWTFYISIIAAGLTLAGSCMVWIEAIMTHRKLGKIRYTQIRTPRSQHEGDVDLTAHNKYVYNAQPPPGVVSPGMQPVMFQDDPYRQPSAPPQPSRGVGFQDYETKSSPPTKRRSPPPPRRRSLTPSDDDTPPPRRRSPPPRRRSPSPHGRDSPPSRRRSPPPRRRSPSPPGRRSSPPPRRGGPPSVTSSMSEGPYISREIDL